MTWAEASDSPVLLEIAVSWEVIDLFFLTLMEQVLLVYMGCVQWRIVGPHMHSK